MKKSLLVIFALTGALTLISCGKKDGGGSACPAGQMQITDQRMLQIYNSYYGGAYGAQPYGQGYNQGYNQGYYPNQNQHGYQQGVACVDQYRYQQIQQQAYGYSNVNGGYNQPGMPNGGYQQPGGSPSSVYCLYFPYDSFCTGRWY